MDLPSQERPASLGRYRILGELGRGGMGVVLLGEDSGLEREVAIKTLPQHLSGNPLAYARFQREARLLAALNHPNIATIYSLETVDSTPILTMERIRGVTLAHRLSEGSRLPLREAVGVGASIGRALEAAHDRGVIHRDLKPGNVMIREDGAVKVLDFGLATEVVSPNADTMSFVDMRADDASVGEAARIPPSETRLLSKDELNALDLTSTGAESLGGGTPGYMSPEQIRGQPLDARSDIFAFGCVLFECLAGTPFAGGATPVERIHATLSPSRNAEDLPEDVPASIRTMIGKCLAQDLRERLPEIRLARQILEETIEQWTVERRARETGIADKTRSREMEGVDSGAAFPGNLPQLLTSFVGRKRELEQLVEMLRDGQRMITLTGPGGSGKTRLALEVARSWAAHFPDGMWFVELASITDPRLVDKMIMTAAGIEEKTELSIREAIVRHFEKRTSLLVLDNCEHLLGASAEVVHALLRRSAHTRVLATSREILGVGGEVRFVVPPLTAPDERSRATLDDLRTNEAVALFADRAQQVQRDFTVTEDNLEAIVGICRRLDGLPLAIELAASRIRALAPAEILRRLDDRFRLLSGHKRDQLPHHRTLWASIDWSHEQLDESERTLLRRLSIFVGGWFLSAAETVCAGSGIEDWEILESLTKLIDKSLVEIDFTRESPTPRYRMLETIREYAGAKLKESGETADQQRRFLTHFRDFAVRGANAMAGADASEWLANTDLDYGNLRETIRLGLADPENLPFALATAASLSRYWIKRNHWAEGRSFLAQALAHPNAEQFPSLRARALNSAGALAYTSGDYGGAVPLLLEATKMFEAEGDQQSWGRALMNLGNAESFLAHYDVALDHLGRALALAREIGDKWLIAACLVNICNSSEAIGDHERMEAASKEGVALFQSVGDKAGLLMAQNYLAVSAFRRGRFEEALPHCNLSIEIANQIGDRYHGAMMRMHRGLVLSGLDRDEEARGDFEASLTTAREYDEPMLQATTIEAFIGLAAKLGDYVRAARLIGFIEERRRALPMPRRQFDDPPFREQHREIRNRLGDSICDELEASGRALSLDDAIAYATGRS